MHIFVNNKQVMRKLLFLILFLPIVSLSQVINPTPDMVFKGQLGAGRGVATDQSAYFSVGPTSGSVRGVVFPRVSDTNSVVSPRRNGLFIWSLQKDRFLYWDSIRSRWKEIPDVSNIDTLVIGTRAWRQKGDDSLSVIINTMVPQVRTITINGNSQNLTANRSWIVGTVRKVMSGLGLTGGPIVDSGTLSVDTFVVSTKYYVKKMGDSILSVINTKIDTNVMSTRAWRQKGDDSLGYLISLRVPSPRTLTINGTTFDLSANRTWSVGTVTNVSTGYGLIGGPITTTGTLEADTGQMSTRVRLKKVADSLALLISSSGGGTVLSVAAGTGMSFPTITSSGSVSADTSVLSTRLWRQKGIDSISLVLGSKVDTARVLTINGLSQSLSANRTWSVGTVTNVAAVGGSGVSVSGSPIVSSGTLTITGDTSILSTRLWRQKGIDSVVGLIASQSFDTTILATRRWRQKGDDSLGYLIDQRAPLTRNITINGVVQNLTTDRTWNVGTVTSVGTGYGLSGGAITTSGTLIADSFSLSTRPRLQKVADSLALLISSAGGGTVLSVSAGTGMSFSTITSSGAVSADTLTLSTRRWRQKGDDSLGALVSLKVNISDTSSMLSPYLRKADTVSLSNRINLKVNILDTSSMLTPYIRHAGFGLVKTGQALATDTFRMATRAWRQKGDDSLAALISASGGGTVTSVTAGLGLSGGTITSSGTIALDTSFASTRAWRKKGDDSLGVIIATKEPTIPAGTTLQYWRGDKSWQTLNTSVVPESGSLYYTDARSRSAISLTTTGSSGASTYTTSTGILNIPNYTLAGLGGVPATRFITINGVAQDLSTNRTWNVGTITGGGTQGFVPRFTPDGTTLNNSLIFDNGANIGIGTVSPTYRFHVTDLGSTANQAYIAATIFGSNGNGATITPGDSKALSIFGQSGNGVLYTGVFGGVGKWGFNTTSVNASILNLNGNMTIGGGYLGTSAPTNGLIVEGDIGAGTSSPTQKLDVNGRVRIRTIDSTSTAINLLYADATGIIKKAPLSSIATGTVTSVAAGVGMSFSTITTTGTVNADTFLLSTRPWRQKAVDSLNVNIATKVDNSRTITINGNAQDLSANRTWNVGTVTSVSAGTGMSFSTITTTGPVNVDTFSISTRKWRQKGIDSIVSIIGEIPYILSDTIVAAGSAKYMRQGAFNQILNTVVSIGGSTRVVTVNAIAYVPVSSWSQTAWNLVGSITGSGSIFLPARNIVFPGVQYFYDGGEYKRVDGVAFTGDAAFLSTPTLMVDRTGDVYARGNDDAIGFSAGGVDYVPVTINITYSTTILP